MKLLLPVCLVAAILNTALLTPALTTGAEGPTSFAGAQVGPSVYASNTASGSALQALSASGPAIYGHSASGVGLLGSSHDYVGVEGVSSKSVGVKGVSYSSFGVVGETHVTGAYLAGVYGVDVTPTPYPPGIPNAGVTGYSMNGYGTIAQTSYGQTALLAFAGAMFDGTMLPPQGHSVAVYGENADAKYPPAQFVQENGNGPLLLVVNSATGAWAEVDAQGNLHISGQVYAGSAPLPTPTPAGLVRRFYRR